MKAKLPKPIQTAGFSLIEALIAALVLGVGILGLAKLQGEVLFGSADSRMRTQALNLAQEKIEEFRNFANRDAYDTFAAGSNASNETIMAGANANFTRTWAVGACPNAINCKQITVTVTWADRDNQNQQVQLTSYIAQADPVKGGIAIAALSYSSGSSSSGTSSSSSSSSSGSSSSSSESSSSSSSSSSSESSSSSSSSESSSSSSSSSSPLIGGGSITGSGNKEDCISSISISGVGGSGSCNVNNAQDTYTCAVILNIGFVSLTQAQFSATIGGSGCGNVVACIGNQSISAPSYTIGPNFNWPNITAKSNNC